jgi:signal transduction histidine kinase
MKRHLKWGLFIFGVTFFAFFGIHYIFLLQQGFSPSSYLTGALFLIPAVLVVGYIFLSQLLEHQERQEERLEHLVREVLHEINLPISTIEANLSMVRKAIPPEEPRLSRRLERIGSASRRLKKLYRELAYNIRREIMPVEKERFDLAELLRDRIASFREMGRNPIVAELEPLEMEADRIGMEQTVDNLLENAMKYSEKEKPVTVALKKGELRIRDRGIGMDENEILRIFERYYQSDRRSRGEGIGLSLVKRYCDENGIGLKIRSRKGEGTEVILDLERYGSGSADGG